MYGLVLRGLEELVQARLGASVWSEIKVEAQVREDLFIRMNEYPDEVFLRLMEASCRRLNVTPDQLLFDFGERWVRFTGEEGYGSLLAVAGTTFTEVLSNLDHLHARVGRIHSKLRPPRFRVEDLQTNSLTLYYDSTRAGLKHMVLGLLEGLAQRFELKVEVTRVDETGPGAYVFWLRW